MYYIEIIRLKALSLILVLFVAFCSCTKDDLKHGDNNSHYIWVPRIEIKKGDGEANLILTDPTPFTDYVAPGPANPDYFSILLSEDLKNFSFYKKVSSSVTKLPVSDLVNGKAYYFLVTAHKHGMNTVTSDTLMTIPSPENKTQRYLENLDSPVERLSMSYDLNYMTYSSNQMLYCKDDRSGEIKSIGLDARNESWAPKMNKFVYMTHKQEGHTLFPYELKIFDAETAESTTLFKIDYVNYYVMSPSFSPDGKKINFLSSENNAEKYIYDLWEIDLSTNEKKKITNFDEREFSINNKYEWSASGEELYLEGSYKPVAYNSTNIYKMNLATQAPLAVIESRWNESTPSLSPNNTKIAFVSNRSGRDELWLYNTETLKYSQVTGSGAYTFDSRYTNLQWLNENEIVVTVFEKEVSVAVKISLN